MGGSTFLLEDRPARYKLRVKEDAPATGVSDATEWRVFRKFVFETLRRYPEVLRELAEALREPGWAVDS